ncbi:MAG TPA: tetratricopeptide repeat protein [Bryobacteraceae bacterium]|nr:tetratricopeptide repeat protein [Bryobacteraceae bacterium]
MDLAKQLAARGQYADAKSEYEAALRAVSELPNDGRAFLSRLGLGSVAAATGQYTEAEQWDNEAVREGIELYGKDAPGLAIPYGNLAGLYRDQEDYARAEEFARLAVRLISRQQPPVPAAEAELLGSLGGILSARGNFDEAESVLQQSIGIAEELPGSSDILAAGWSNLAGVYTRTGRMKEALALYERARDVYNGAGDRNNPNLFFILSGIASIEGASGSYTLAVDSIESAIQRAEAGGSADTLQVRNALLAEATWLHKLKRDKEAKRVLAKARQVARAASHHSYGQYTVDAREVAQTMVDRAK